MTAELLMLIGGICAFLLTLHWVRNRDLREKYAIVWVAVAFVLLLSGLFPELIMSMAVNSRLSYPSAVLFVALAAVYCFSFSVSVSLTRQYRRNVRLTQELALMDLRLRTIERNLRTANDGSIPSISPDQSSSRTENQGNPS